MWPHFSMIFAALIARQPLSAIAVFGALQPAMERLLGLQGDLPLI
jgi:hypothetical protein